jgi:hypothetical protein
VPCPSTFKFTVDFKETPSHDHFIRSQKFGGKIALNVLWYFLSGCPPVLHSPVGTVHQIWHRKLLESFLLSGDGISGLSNQGNMSLYYLQWKRWRDDVETHVVTFISTVHQSSEAKKNRLVTELDWIHHLYTPALLGLALLGRFSQNCENTFVFL